MTLPSPIPHPVSYLDTTGKWRDAIEFVVGSHWPDGDEAAMRNLAAEWREAARHVRSTMAEAGRASGDAVAGFGGSGTGSAFQDAWQRVSSGFEVESFERLAELADAGAEVVETAKRDVYAEVAALVDELERSGSEVVGLEDSRAAVEQIVRRASGRMQELALRPMGDVEPLRPFAYHPELAPAAGSGSGSGSASSPVAAAAAQPEGVLPFAAGIASLGGPVPLGSTLGTGGGPRTVTALKGRYGERAIRGPGGAILSEISIGVIAKEGVEWSGLAGVPAAAPAPLVSPVTVAPSTGLLAGDGSSGLLSSGSSSASSPGGSTARPEVTLQGASLPASVGLALPGDSSGGATVSLAPANPAPAQSPAAPGVSGVGLGGATVGTVMSGGSPSGASSSASGSATGGGVSAAAAGLASAATAGAPVAVAGATAAGGSTAGATAAGGSAAGLGSASGTGAATAFAGGALGAAAGAGSTAAVGLGVSSVGAVPGSLGGGSASVGAIGGSAAPGVGPPGSPGSAGGASGTGSVGGASAGGGSAASSGGASGGTGSSVGAGSASGSAGGAAASVASSGGASGGSGGSASGGSASGSGGARSAAGVAEAASAEVLAQGLAVPAGRDQGDGDTTFVPWLIVAAMDETPSSGAVAAEAPGEGLPDAEIYERHVQAQLRSAEDEAVQQLWDETVKRAGGVAQRAHQGALEQTIERDETGQPERFLDLAGAWLGRVNAGGPLADRRRAINAAEVALSLVDTWLHGRPRVALPGTKEEIEGLKRFAADRDGLNKLEAALKIQGHGACAVMVQEWPYGEVHATTVHNQRGELVYVDAQRADQPLNAEPVPGAVRMGIVAFGPEGKRIDIGG